MTAKKKILDLTGLQYLVQKVRSAINDVDSPLSTHIADTDIHVTTADKSTWNTVTSKANDSDVVHKSGNETIGGAKNFTDNISAKKIISNVAQLQINARSSADSVAVIAGDKASEGSGIWLYGKDNATGSDCRIQIYNTSKSRFERTDLVGSQFLPSPSGELDCGSTTNKWKTFNGLNPSSLSLPSISNRIDISSYITDLNNGNNEYTPSVNGWISIRSANATKISILDKVTYVGDVSVSKTATYLTVTTPVVANRPVYITVMCTSLSHAYFIPCQGNV